MEQDSNMAKVYLSQILLLKADPAVLDDVDRYLVTYIDESGYENTVATTYKPIVDEKDVEDVLKEAVAKKKPKKTEINLTKEWKGEYII
jgi:hypothetical protein